MDMWRKQSLHSLHPLQQSERVLQLTLKNVKQNYHIIHQFHSQAHTICAYSSRVYRNRKRKHQNKTCTLILTEISSETAKPRFQMFTYREYNLKTGILFIFRVIKYFKLSLWQLSHNFEYTNAKLLNYILQMSYFMTHKLQLNKVYLQMRAYMKVYFN